MKRALILSALAVVIMIAACVPCPAQTPQCYTLVNGVWTWNQICGLTPPDPWQIILGKIFTVDNTLTLKGQDKAVLDIRSGGVLGPAAYGNLVTALGSPGSNANIPSEKAVRDAINAIPTGGGGTGITNVMFTHDYTTVGALTAALGADNKLIWCDSPIYLTANDIIPATTSFYRATPACLIINTGGGSKLNQTITWNVEPNAALTVGLSESQGSASASSGLTVSYSTNNAAICTTDGTNLTGIGAGACYVLADQAGNTTYNAAPQASSTLVTVSAAPVDTTPSATVLDNFNRADENPLTTTNWYGSPWSSNYPLQVVSNAAKGTQNLAWNGGAWKGITSANDEIVVTVATLPAQYDLISLLVRHEHATHQGYECEFYMDTTSTVQWKLYRWDTNASIPSISGGYSSGGPISNGDKIACQMQGSVVKAWKYHAGAWSKLGQATDATYATAGGIGFGIGNFALSPTTVIDDFSGKVLP